MSSTLPTAGNDVFSSTPDLNGFIFAGGAGDDTYVLDFAHAYDLFGPPSIVRERPGEGYDTLRLVGVSPNDLQWMSPDTPPPDVPGAGADYTFHVFGVIGVFEFISFDAGAGDFWDAFERIEFDDGTVWTVQTGFSFPGLDPELGGAQGVYAAGTLGADDLIGGAGDDFLIGGPGDDVLTGGAGADRLFGGAGSDIYRLAPGAGDFVVDTGPVADMDVLDLSGLSVDPGYAFIALTERLTEGLRPSDQAFVGIEVFIGSDFRDAVMGSNADNILRGRGGMDELDGGAGDDVLFGGADADFLQGGTGNDILYGGGGSGFLFGQDGDDLIVGGQEADQITGGAGADRLAGKGGSDVLRGGSGADWLHGGSGIDFLQAGAGDDTVLGGGGGDRVLGGAGQDRLWGGKGDDMLFGAQPGASDGQPDVFVFKTWELGGGGYDVIRDFEDGIDQLDVTEAGFDSFADLRSHAVSTGQGVLLDIPEGGMVHILGLSLAILTSDDVWL